MGARQKLLHGGIVVIIGVLVGTVPAFDIFDDIVYDGDPPVTTAVENSPLLLLSLGVVAVGLWLVRCDWSERYTRTVTKVGVANVVAVAAVMGLVVFVQSELQNSLKPFVIAADAVVVGALTGIVLGVRTAQERQVAHEARAQRDRFRALFENVPNPVVGVEVVDDEPIVRAVNPTFTEVFGLSERTIVGDSLEAYIVPSDEPADPIDGSTVDDAEPVGDRSKEAIALETATGRRQFVRVTAPVEEGTDRDGYTMYIDVTDQRQRRERLHVLSRTLRHDIRNKLNLIEPIATEFTKELDGSYAQQAELIENAAGDLLDVSDRTRRVERQVAGGGDPDALDLSRVVTEVAEDLRSQYDCRIVVDVGTDRRAVYGAVAEGFPLAVEEMVRNGIEHGDRPTPTVEVSLSPSPDDEYCDVRVADDGPGIPDTQVAVVTREIEHTQTEHAHGLGLWTARWVLQNSGGELRFEPNSPCGTVVILRVPRAEVDGRA